MRHALILIGTMVMLANIAGCGGDDRERLADITLNTITEVKGNLDDVTSELKKAVEEHNAKRKALSVDDITRAVVKAEDLKKYGKKLQDIKERMDMFREKTTDDQRAKLAEYYKTKLIAPLEGLEESDRQLQAVLKDVADLIGRETTDNKRLLENALDQLRKTVREGYEPFELLTKQRS